MPAPEFITRIERPEQPDGNLFVLLHGSGRDENDLIPFGRALNPRAALFGVRGRADKEGFPRYYHRLTPVTFDQDSIRSEAADFALFLTAILARDGISPDKTTVIGYSNGANFAAALMALSPGLIRRAILMRPMAALDELPEVDLTETHVLTIAGTRDPTDHMRHA